MYNKIWDENYTSQYSSTVNAIDSNSYLGSDEFYIDDVHSEVIPFIAANTLLINDSNSDLLQIHTKKYLNDTNISNYRILNRDSDDTEAEEYYLRNKQDFMCNVVADIINRFDSDDFRSLCYNKSRRFVRVIQLQNKRSDVEMRHLPNAKVQDLENFIEYQLLKGFEYESAQTKP